MPSLETIAKFFTVVPDPMILVNSKGVIVLANSHAYKLFGHAPDELTGKPVACLLPERYRVTHEKRLEDYFRSPFVRLMGIGMELSACRADDSEFPVEISLSPFHTSDAVFALAAIRDITERKHLEEARRESEIQKGIAGERRQAALVLEERNESLNALFDASPIGILTTTQSGIIDRWNRTAEKIFGYAASEVLGRNAADFVEDIRICKDPDQNSIFPEVLHGSEARNHPARCRRKDGRIEDVRISSARFINVSGEKSGFVFLVDDVSEREMVEQQLRQSQKMEAIGQLTGGIAHDFNNLLSIIICNLELLEETLLPQSEGHELSEAALQASLRGAELIKQILAFSRKQKLEPKRIKVNELVKSMTSLLTRSLGEQIEIVLEMAPELWPVTADSVQLETALVNLATNARDAMPQGGKLVIQTGNKTLDEAYVRKFSDLTPGEYVLVSVTDSGHGMPLETVERAFDPFFTTKAAGVGTGLGLSMVFGFVKQSGGHVRIYSELGQGTTVRLYLPRAHAELAEAAQPPEVPKKQLARGARLLIVEDNKELAKSAHRVISEAGFDAQGATNAEEAIDLLRGGLPFDVLFTDIILNRGANGIELAEEAMKLKPNIRVLFTSGFSEAALRASGKAVVAGHFLAKPYRKEELIARINSLMESCAS